MIESYRNAVEEYKRVDHLYYVTLKYTRTVDVIRGTIERLISTFEYSIDAILKVLEEEKKIEDAPKNPVMKAKLVGEIFEEEAKNHMDLYLFLRKVMRMQYGRREEFRRHVTMIVDFEGKDKDIDIDILKEYYDDTGSFLSFVKELVAKYKDD